MKKMHGFGFDPNSPVYWLLIAVCASTGVMILVSLFTRPKDSDQLKGLVWARQDTLTFGSHLLQSRTGDSQDNAGGQITGHLGFWRDYRLLGLAAYIIMTLMIWFLR